MRGRDRLNRLRVFVTCWWLAALLPLGLGACAGAGNIQEPVGIAVWDLENLGAVTQADGSMGTFLATQIAAHFETVSGYRVVERQELLKALEELNLGSSQLADRNTRLKLGAIIGAKQMVFGAYQKFGDALRVDVRLVDVASGKILKTASAVSSGTGSSALLDAADKAAQGLLGQ